MSAYRWFSPLLMLIDVSREKKVYPVAEGVLEIHEYILDSGTSSCVASISHANYTQCGPSDFSFASPLC